MIKVTYSSTTTVPLTEKEAKDVTLQYLQLAILGGEGCYVTKEGMLEHWTSWPHGSGTTTPQGEATEVQRLAQRLLELLE